MTLKQHDLLSFLNHTPSVKKVVKHMESYRATQTCSSRGWSSLTEQSMGLTVAEAFRSVMTVWKCASTSAAEQEEGIQTASVRSRGSA